LDFDQRFEVFDLGGYDERGRNSRWFLAVRGKISLALTFPEDVQQEVCDASE
jgi:hypothetical protein